MYNLQIQMNATILCTSAPKTVYQDSPILDFTDQQEWLSIDTKGKIPSATSVLWSP